MGGAFRVRLDDKVRVQQFNKIVRQKVLRLRVETHEFLSKAKPKGEHT